MSVSQYYCVLDSIEKKANQLGRSLNTIQLVAITKYQEVKKVRQLYELGCRNFGESRLQESLVKLSELPLDCQWHFIGSLQKNKVLKVVENFDLIHSVDSVELAKKISEVSLKLDKKTAVLLQVNTSLEETKHGLIAEQWERSLNEINQLNGIRVEGLMTMGPLTQDQAIIRKCFRELYRLREKWQDMMKEPEIFQHLSMGMSHDYLIAIEEGATLLRIGSAIFS